MLKTNQRETKLFEFSRDMNSKELKNDVTLQSLHFVMALLCNDTTSLYSDYAFKKAFCRFL